MKEFFQKQNNVQAIVEAGDNNFNEEVLQRSNKTPVVVDFWSPLCLPCTRLGPVLEKLANDHKGGFVLAKINVDLNPRISHVFSVSSIPSVKMFKNGVVVSEFVGALGELSVQQWLNTNLNGQNERGD
ncbi:thiol reductase thioredoxin [archaeon]|nr:thiol reductase thioredoxin [archaeon]